VQYKTGLELGVE